MFFIFKLALLHNNLVIAMKFISVSDEAPEIVSKTIFRSVMEENCSYVHESREYKLQDDACTRSACNNKTAAYKLRTLFLKIRILQSRLSLYDERKEEKRRKHLF